RRCTGRKTGTQYRQHIRIIGFDFHIAGQHQIKTTAAGGKAFRAETDVQGGFTHWQGNVVRQQVADQAVHQAADRAGDEAVGDVDNDAGQNAYQTIDDAVDH